MADVRGASGAPGVNQFEGAITPTQSTPLYVDLGTGDLYVLINNAVTLVGAIPGGSSFVIGQQSFDKHYSALPGVIGMANEILEQRAFAPRPLPAMWS